MTLLADLYVATDATQERRSRRYEASMRALHIGRIVLAAKLLGYNQAQAQVSLHSNDCVADQNLWAELEGRAAGRLMRVLLDGGPL